MTADKAVKLVLFGPPGAGKGTIAAQLLHGLPDGAYLATGDYFRRLVRDGHALASDLQDYMSRGELIPDEIVMAEFETLWASGRFAAGFVFDGFPRSMGQIRALQALLDSSPLGSVEHVVYIEAADQLVLDRLTSRRICPNCDAIYNLNTMAPAIAGKCDKCGADLIQRPDDTEETIRRRLEVYRSQTTGILEYYREAGLLFHLQAEDGLEANVSRIKEMLRSAD